MGVVREFDARREDMILHRYVHHQSTVRFHHHGYGIFSFFAKLFGKVGAKVAAKTAAKAALKTALSAAKSIGKDLVREGLKTAHQRHTLNSKTPKGIEDEALRTCGENL